MSKIGVFDSGVGGMSVVKALRAALTDEEIIFANDAKHVPYGTKTPNEIFGYVLPILQEMVRQECEIIVIACNTVTTTLIQRLRNEISVPLVGIEPMIKTAAAKTIVACASCS